MNSIITLIETTAAPLKFMAFALNRDNHCKDKVYN